MSLRPCWFLVWRKGQLLSLVMDAALLQTLQDGSIGLACSEDLMRFNQFGKRALVFSARV